MLLQRPARLQLLLHHSQAATLQLYPPRLQRQSLLLNSLHRCKKSNHDCCSSCLLSGLQLQLATPEQFLNTACTLTSRLLPHLPLQNPSPLPASQPHAALRAAHAAASSKPQQSRAPVPAPRIRQPIPVPPKPDQQQAARGRGWLDGQQGDMTGRSAGQRLPPGNIHMGQPHPSQGASSQTPCIQSPDTFNHTPAQ